MKSAPGLYLANIKRITSGIYTFNKSLGVMLFPEELDIFHDSFNTNEIVSNVMRRFTIEYFPAISFDTL